LVCVLFTVCGFHYLFQSESGLGYLGNPKPLLRQIRQHILHK
jgi:hypothetical protein